MINPQFRRRFRLASRMCGHACTAGMFCMALAWSGTATAQQSGVGGFNGGGFRSPTTSPYLNLLRNNTFSPALNYYQLVRPEQQMRRYGQHLNNELNGLRLDLTSQGLLPDGSRPLSGTGHNTMFLNTGRYFPGQQSGGRTPFGR